MDTRNHFISQHKYSENQPPGSTSEGDSQGVSPKENPRSEPGRNKNEKGDTIKAIHQCRTS